MASLNHTFEASADACRRQWQAAAERYYQRGLSAANDAWCPYPTTSFAAIHWRKGYAAKGGNA